MDIEVLERTDAPPSSLAVPPSGALAATASPSPAYLLQLAIEQGADIDKLERLMGLQERWEANQAKKAFDEAHAAFKKVGVEIIKRKQVDFTNKSGSRTKYKHAELADVVEALAPALSEHGFSWKWTLKQGDRWLDVTCTLTHKAGHSESVTLGGPPDDSGGKNSIQQIVSTKTYLERHTLKAIAGVAEKGEDDDGAGGPKQTTDITALLVGLGGATTDATALAYYRANKSQLAGDKAATDAFKKAVLDHRENLKRGAA